MFKDDIIDALKHGHIEWRKHALERMLSRNISRSEVISVLENGEVIEYYKNDTPYASGLFLYINKKPIHVVASVNSQSKTIYVITAYIPALSHFLDDFKTRRQNE